MYFVLVLLMVNLFAVIRLCMLVNSKFTLQKIFLELIFEMNTLVSSSKKIEELNFKQLLKSLIYKINSNGPRMDPSATDVVVSFELDEETSIYETCWVLPLR